MHFSPKKILVIRLSSIGDIVMTSPVIRSLKNHFPEAEIHFFTKKAFASLVEHNPHITHVHTYEGNLDTNLKDFRKVGFEYVLDLHNSLRSGFIRRRLGLPSSIYPKFSLQTKLFTRFRIGTLPKLHVVERYGIALKPLNCELDDRGLEIFLPEAAHLTAQQVVSDMFSEVPIAIVLGATYTTKQWIPEYFPELINRLGRPVILLGGKGEEPLAKEIEGKITVPNLNAAGKYSLLESAALLEKCEYVITHDTGMMHIAAALGKKIYSLWGQSVPEFGFSPYKADNTFFQVEDLDCRPCHKLGYDACPKGHFKCMRDLTAEKVYAGIDG